MSFISYLKTYSFGLELRIGKELDFTALGKLKSSLTYNLPVRRLTYAVQLRYLVIVGRQASF